MDVKNIFSSIPKSEKEIIEELIKTDNFKIERIISNNNSTKEGKWYNQDKNEFVLVLKGSAELLFHPEEKIIMNEGDYLTIPAHKKHRVEKTDNETIWLTVFY